METKAYALTFQHFRGGEDKRTRSMIRRLGETSELLKQYAQIIMKQETREFIEKVRSPCDTPTEHYIPHHPFFKASELYMTVHNRQIPPV